MISRNIRVLERQAESGPVILSGVLIFGLGIGTVQIFRVCPDCGEA